MEEIQDSKSFTLGYDFKSYNGALRSEREKRGFSRKEMAEHLGISYVLYCNIERMLYYPGEKVRERIETKLGLLAEDLFPEEIREFDKTAGSVEKDVPLEMLSLNDPSVRELPSVDSAEAVFEYNELKRSLEEVLDTLKKREQYVLMKRFGLKGEEKHSLRQTGVLLGVSPTCVGQVEKNALRKLRHLIFNKGGP